MFHKMAQMIQAHTERMLLDEVFATYRDVQDAAAEMAQVLPCPRCGKQTMKMRLHSNALSRQVPGITICDRCGTEEALEDAVHQPMDVRKWALIEIYMKGANLKCPVHIAGAATGQLAGSGFSLLVQSLLHPA